MASPSEPGVLGSFMDWNHSIVQFDISQLKQGFGIAMAVRREEKKLNRRDPEQSILPSHVAHPKAFKLPFVGSRPVIAIL